MKTFSALIIAGLLLASGWARAEGQSGCLGIQKIQASRRTLQPGGILNVHVRMKTSHCVLANAFGAGTTTTLFIEPRTGFESTTGPLVYSDFENQLSSLDAPQAHVLETTIEVKTVQVAPGKYNIPVFLNYQAVDEQGRVRNESLHFAIPVSVAAKQAFWDEHRDLQKNLVVTGEVFLVVLLSPVLILECVIGGNCWSC